MRVAPGTEQIRREAPTGREIGTGMVPSGRRRRKEVRAKSSFILAFSQSSRRSAFCSFQKAYEETGISPTDKEGEEGSGRKGKGIGTGTATTTGARAATTTGGGTKTGTRARTGTGRRAGIGMTVTGTRARTGTERRARKRRAATGARARTETGREKGQGDGQREKTSRHKKYRIGKVVQEGYEHQK